MQQLPLDLHTPHLTTLADKAMLVRVKIGTYSPYAFDADATERAYGNSKVGRANKHLLKESARLKATNEAYNAIRAALNKRTAPWLDEGTRMFKNEDYLGLVKELASLKHQADSLADDLEANWDWEVQQDYLRFDRIAQDTSTVTVFDPHDYPAHIRNRFYCEVRYLPMPDAGDFRVDLGAEQQAAFEQTIREAEMAATKYAVNQMTEPTAALLKKLTEYTGEKGQRWHESLISNVLDVTRRIRFMNISEDPTLYQIARDLEAFITPYTFAPTALKENPDARATAKAKLDAIMSKMGGYMGGEL